MKPWIAVAVSSLALWVGCATSPAPKESAALEMGKQVTSLYSASGVNVQLLRWGAEAQQEALLLFRGLEHPWADKVVVHKVQPCQYGQCYSTEVSGHPWTSLLLGKGSAELYLPFMEDDVPLSLSYATEGADTLKPKELAKMFESQKGE